MADPFLISAYAFLVGAALGFVVGLSVESWLTSRRRRRDPVADYRVDGWDLETPRPPEAEPRFPIEHMDARFRGDRSSGDPTL